jgi:hypothetical protein
VYSTLSFARKSLAPKMSRDAVLLYFALSWVRVDMPRERVLSSCSYRSGEWTRVRFDGCYEM